jgi:hypothetical protein
MADRAGTVVTATAAMLVAVVAAMTAGAGTTVVVVVVVAAAGMTIAGEAVTTADMVLRSLPCFLSSCLVLYAVPHSSVRAGADRSSDRPRDEPNRRIEPPRGNRARRD